MTIAYTTNFHLAYCDDQTALTELATVTQQVADTVDAAMGRAGYTPPDSTSFAALSARVAALEVEHSRRRYLAGTAQSLPSGATTTVALNTDDTGHNTGTWITNSGSGFTVSHAGLYLAAANLQFVGGTAGTRSLSIAVGGTARVIADNPSATAVRLAVSAVLKLAAGDVVTMGGFVGGGTAATAGTTLTTDTALTLTKIRGGV